VTIKRVIEGCQLEIDAERGVIYVHSPLGYTVLRICGLKGCPDLLMQDQLDVSITPLAMASPEWHRAVLVSGTSLRRTTLPAPKRKRRAP